MSLNRPLQALGEGKYFFEQSLCIPFHRQNYLSKHMAGFLTVGDGNKPSASGSNTRTKDLLLFCFPLCPSSSSALTSPTYFLIFVFLQDTSMVQSQYDTWTPTAKVEKKLSL